MIVKDRKIARFNINTTESQKEYVDQQAKKMGIPVSEFLRELIDEHKEKNRSNQLRDAANLLAADYEKNGELTEFSAIDGDDFL